MNLENFIVRPRRRQVEKYGKPDAWAELKLEDIQELAREVAGLPSEVVDNDEEAKRFDLLILRLQLNLLRAEPGFERLRDQVRALAALLEEKSTIPMVHEQMALIQEIQSDAYWQDVNPPMLDAARKRLRALIKFIEKAKRKPVYTDFEDQLGNENTVELPGFGSGTDFERFRAKARQFLTAHEENLTIHKLRLNEPLTATDLKELERLLLSAGVGTAEDVAQAKEISHGLGLFIRSLVGLDREAAKNAFGHFLVDRSPSGNQIEFIDLIINYLTQHGTMEPGRLYESPFTDINPRGPEAVFTSIEVDELVSVLKEIHQRAVA